MTLHYQFAGVLILESDSLHYQFAGILILESDYDTAIMLAKYKQ